MTVNNNEPDPDALDIPEPGFSELLETESDDRDIEVREVFDNSDELYSRIFVNELRQKIMIQSQKEMPVSSTTLSQRSS